MRLDAAECGQCGRPKALYQTSGFVTTALVFAGFSVSAAMLLAAVQAG